MLKTNFHDATLDAIELKILGSTTLILSVSFYVNEQSRARVPGVVTISNVTSMSSTIDFKRQEHHRSFGNIADWSPATRRGPTSFYLAGGMITVFGDVPEIQVIDTETN
ncbi:hypothetical protein P3W24_11600 [Luteibacter sp. PPL201]|uniref:Uncharacterized protein n=1 Tax=Luteibacter sahnii TaxID=3021977 RepID=A0ABT6BBW0_9GAMM